MSYAKLLRTTFQRTPLMGASSHFQSHFQQKPKATEQENIHIEFLRDAHVLSESLCDFLINL